MNVKDLVLLLEKMPQEAQVDIFYDGSLREDLLNVWLARSGNVGLGGEIDLIMYTEDRLIEAPTVEEQAYWGFNADSDIEEEEDDPVY